MFGWDFEVDAWSRFWRWNLIKICVWTCDMNSTLVSVVPLAMFFLNKRNDESLNTCCQNPNLTISWILPQVPLQWHPKSSPDHLTLCNSQNHLSILDSVSLLLKHCALSALYDQNLPKQKWWLMTFLQTISSIQRKAHGLFTKVERYNGWSCPPPLVHSSSDHQALNTEDNNPTPVQLCSHCCCGQNWEKFVPRIFPQSQKWRHSGLAFWLIGDKIRFWKRPK